MKVLTIKIDEQTFTEVHMLHPGQHFERFGGSSAGLTVRKTASLITRADHGHAGRMDAERDITDKYFWEFIAKCINGEIKATATIDEPHVPVDVREKAAT